MFNIAVSCLVLTAVLAYLNHRYLHLPMTIGVMSIALVLSFGLIGLDKLGIDFIRVGEKSLLSINFSEILLQGMLSLLLFAGAMHIDLSALTHHKWQIGLLSVLGTVVSMFIVGFGIWMLLPVVGIPLPLTSCLLFGALISPTDPIAVLGILKSARAPEEIEIVIAGESLFNDGIGVVLFSLLFEMVEGGRMPTLQGGAALLLQEAGGGIAFGLVLGYVTYRMLKSIDSYQEEVLLTLAAVMGGYALANQLHISGPLAMVVTGIFIGNHGRAAAMSDTTRNNLDLFWGLLDQILNAVLFVLIGLEVLLISFSWQILLAMLVALVITFVARLLSAGLPVGLFCRAFGLPPGSWKVLTWAGLRGGISVALALSLPAGPERELLLALTYAVVVFTILGQGLTIRAVVRRAMPAAALAERG